MTWFNHCTLARLERVTHKIFNAEQSLILSGIWPERPFPLRSLHTEHWINYEQHIYYKELLNIVHIKTISLIAMNPKCLKVIYSEPIQWTSEFTYIDSEIFRFPITGEISPLRFRWERLMQPTNLVWWRELVAEHLSTTHVTFPCKNLLVKPIDIENQSIPASIHKTFREFHSNGSRISSLSILLLNIIATK